MQYFHRTHALPDAVMAEVARWFGARLAPVIDEPRRRRYSGGVGTVTITVQPEGGHYTLVTVATDQPGESELDKLGKRFLSELHTLTHPDHALRGAY
jgi:hypothetical protein